MGKASRLLQQPASAPYGSAPALLLNSPASLPQLGVADVYRWFRTCVFLLGLGLTALVGLGLTALVGLGLTTLVATGLPAQEPEQPFGFRLTEWNQTLSDVARMADREDLGAATVNELRDRLQTVRQAALEARSTAESRLEPLRDRLRALGPAPGEEDPPESADIAAQRSSIEEQIAVLRGHVTQTELTVTRAEELDSRLSAYTRERTIARVLTLYPFPLAPSTIAVTVPEVFRHAAVLARAPVEWWANRSPDEVQQIVLHRLTIVLLLAIAIGWGLRRLLLRWFGRDPEIENPTYVRRVLGAVSEGVADGIIPALIFGGFLYRAITGSSLATGLYADIVAAACISLIIFIVASALSHAALAPGLPNWRLAPIAPDNARKINHYITILAALFAIDVFILTVTAGLPTSEEFESVYELVTGSVEAVFVLALTRASLWVAEGEPVTDDADAAEDETPDGEKGRFWYSARLIIRLLAVAAVVASLIGYAALGSYLMNNLLATGVVGGALFLIRGLVREVIGVGLRSDLVQSRLGFKHRTRSLIKFWLRAFLDVSIFAFGLMVVLPIWGVPARDMLTWVGEVLQGVTVGNVTLSVSDIAVGLLIFTLTIVITRVLQRVLSDKVLPQTTLDSGVQHSLAAGFGYLGLILAAALAISAIGLDLSNLALIAGALSVGIGFGLQTVVNNFVSGLILLVERPIKVGDWIIASGHEGYVKRINVRATELETFQRASVIIPNSELVSTSVINWTHKNTLGRAEVPVGVAYGSDVEQVTEILMTCLQADERILKWPEPFVLFQGFGDSSLDFEARGYIGDVGWVVVIESDLRYAIYKALNEAGVEIPFPQRDLHLKDVDRLADAIGSRPPIPEAFKTPPKKPPKKPRRRPAPSTGSDVDGARDGDGED